jgi:2-(1,2-epoxy-1,2-dihydrophenyl)acetyl-CoA isomerase
MTKPAEAAPDFLGYEVADRIATLTLNRPEHRNAMSPELASAMILRLREAAGDVNVKCVVIRGAGDNLSAGGDVKGFSETLKLSPGERYDQFERRLLVANRLPLALVGCPKPVLVIAHGAVAGAGLALCFAADIVVAAESAFFVAAHVHVGLSLDTGLSGLMIPAMGIKSAKRLALLGDRVTAKQALELGIVTEVVADADLSAHARKLAERLAAGPGTAMANSKALLNRAAYQGFAEQLAEEALAIAQCVATDDFRAGIEATLERRRPAFK